MYYNPQEAKGLQKLLTHNLLWMLVLTVHTMRSVIQGWYVAPDIYDVVFISEDLFIFLVQDKWVGFGRRNYLTYIVMPYVIFMCVFTTHVVLRCSQVSHLSSSIWMHCRMSWKKCTASMVLKDMRMIACLVAGPWCLFVLKSLIWESRFEVCKCRWAEYITIWPHRFETMSRFRLHNKLAARVPCQLHLHTCPWEKLNTMNEHTFACKCLKSTHSIMSFTQENMIALLN